MIYTYRCSKCLKEFDLVHGFEDKPLLTCACCGGDDIRKVLSVASVLYKGSGFTGALQG